jgi:hypothetical protein
MNKIFFLLTLIISTNFCVISQIAVPNVQKTLYTTVEATWCGNCGQYGVPTTANLNNQIGEKMTPLVLHASNSSDLHSPIAASFNSALGGSGQPKWHLDGGDAIYNSTSIETTLSNVINFQYNSTSCSANSGFIWAYDEDSIFIRTKTVFFENLDGEYYLALYISEDSIWNYQANYGSAGSGNIYHNHVLRSSITNNVYGSSLVSGNTSSGSEYFRKFVVPRNSNWNMDQIHITAVMWKKNGSTYEFVNTNNKGELTQEVLDINMSQELNPTFSVYPNPVTSYINITTENFDKINIFNAIGQNTYSKTNPNNIEIVDFTNLPKGVYYIRVDKDENSITKKIIVN